jgi:hypothetical protein
MVLKPPKCKTCGTTDPEKFNKSTKSECSSCKTKRLRRKRELNPAYAKARTEQAKRSVERSVESFLRTSLLKAQRTATKKIQPFEVPVDFILRLWERQDGICALTGIRMVHKFGDLRSVSIDRLDSNKPYSIGNIQLVCKAINIGKNTHQQHEMIEFLREIRETTPPDQEAMLEARKRAI